MLPNAVAQDTRLSWAARGLLIELLSRPVDWEANADALSERAKAQRGEKVGEGRRAVRAAFTELETLGYIVRTRKQVERGRFNTIIDVYDTPGHHRRTADGMSASGPSASGRSDTGTSLQRTDLQRTDTQSTGYKDSSTLADARVGALPSAGDREARATNDDPWALVDEARAMEIARDHIINGGTLEEGLRQAEVQAQKTTLAAQGRDSDLDRLSDAVDRMPPSELSDALVSLELRRRRIYANARRDAMDQFEREDRQVLRGPNSGEAMHALTYKHALLHYFDTAEEWPAWLIRPLTAYIKRVA